MKSKERWVKWEPIKGLSSIYDIDSIIDNPEGFSMILSEFDNPKKKLRVIFEDSVDAYRSTDEGYQLAIKDNLEQKDLTNLYGKWAFFKVINSDYIKWLSEQSYGLADRASLIHLAFVGANFIVDVVAGYEPRIEFVD